MLRSNQHKVPIMSIRAVIPILYILNIAVAPAQENIFLSPQSHNLEKFIPLKEHFPPPAGYHRISLKSNSFAAYLRNLPLIDDSHNVQDYKGGIHLKAGDSSLAAIVPFDISGNRLWQCMDIILMLKIDYLKQENNVGAIEFPLPDGTTLSWPGWRNGFRLDFKGLQFYKIKSATQNSSDKNFKKYLNTIFSYSNTQTFHHHYPRISLDVIKAGNFIVKKGKKGHAVLIVDIAVNDRGEKIALIGQGDTPACQFYLLKNKNGSPWFKVSNQTSFPELPIAKKMYWSGLRGFPQ